MKGCCPLRSVCFLSHENEWEFLHLVCWRFSLLIKMSSSELHTAPWKRRNAAPQAYIRWDILFLSLASSDEIRLSTFTQVPYWTAVLYFMSRSCDFILSLHFFFWRQILHFLLYYIYLITLSTFRLHAASEATIAFWICTYFIGRILNCLKGNILTKMYCDCHISYLKTQSLSTHPHTDGKSGELL